MMIKGEEKYWTLEDRRCKPSAYWQRQHHSLRIGKKFFDRPIQLLYALELHSEGIRATNEDEKKNELNPSRIEFHPKRTAAEIAKWPLKDIAIEEDDGDI